MQINRYNSNRFNKQKNENDLKKPRIIYLQKPVYIILKYNCIIVL